MIKDLMASQIVDVAAKIRAFPTSLKVGDFFTGAGSFSLIMKAIVNGLEAVVPMNEDFPDDLEGVSGIEFCLCYVTPFFDCRTLGSLGFRVYFRDFRV